MNDSNVITPLTFYNNITNFLLSISEDKHYPIQSSLQGFLIKIPFLINIQSSNEDEYVYIFISNDFKYFIKAVFTKATELLKQFTSKTVYEINLVQYTFDFFIFAKDQYDLIYNIVLLISEFSCDINQNIRNDLTDVLNYSSLYKASSKPININNNELIKTKQTSALISLLKKRINEYAGLYSMKSFNANNFLNQTFNETTEQTIVINLNTNSILDICNKVSKKDSEGLLLCNKIGINCPEKYITSSENENDDINLNDTYNFDWKKLLVNTPTFKNKLKDNVDNKDYDIFQASSVNMRVIDDSLNEIENQIYKNRNKKERKIKKGEHEALPQKIKDLIDFYGNINSGIGFSMVEKYLLFKKISNGLNAYNEESSDSNEKKS